MPRLTLALIALAGLLAGALGTSLVTRPQPADPAAIRAIVDTALAERQAAAPQAVAALDPATLNPMIESYLLSNPRLLERVSNALQAQRAAEQQGKTRDTLASLHAAIYDDPDHVVLGNPNGDVTLVEMFDYNCTYCRQAVPDMAALLAEDPNLKIILKEFPILSQESFEAARVAVLVGKSDVDYWAFHEALFTSRGQVTGETALDVAQKLGLNKINLGMDMGTQKVTAAIEKSYAIARALDISGTPAYIIGNEVIPGAVGLDQLRQRIANMRACGATVCPEAAAPATGG